MQTLTFYMANIAVQFPLLIVLVMGLFYAVSNWRKHPAASGNGTWAMGLAVAVIFADAGVVHAAVSLVLHTKGEGLYWVINFFRFAVMALAWGLMIAAAFHERPDESAGGPA